MKPGQKASPLSKGENILVKLRRTLASAVGAEGRGAPDDAYTNTTYRSKHARGEDQIMKVEWSSTFPWIHFIWNDASTPPKEETKTVSTPLTPKPANVPTTTQTSTPQPPVPPKPPVTPVPVPIYLLPTKTVDVLDIMQFNVPGFCLSGSYDVRLVAPALQIHTKNPIGYPNDIRFYDANWVYDQKTEINWIDPAFVKLHVNNGGRGNRMCKRTLSPADFPYSVSETSCPVLYFKNGQYDFFPEDAGPTTFTWHAPYYKDWGNDVGFALTYQVDYYWSDKKDREQYFFCPKFLDGGIVPDKGLVDWNHGVLQSVLQPDGSYYKLDNTPSVNNVLQSLAAWQKTYPQIKSFTWIDPIVSTVKFPRGTY